MTKTDIFMSFCDEMFYVMRQGEKKIHLFEFSLHLSLR